MASKKQHLFQYATNISQVLRNRTERSNATYIEYPDGTRLIHYKGNVLTPDAFENLLPIEVKSVSVKGEPISTHQKMVA